MAPMRDEMWEQLRRDCQTTACRGARHLECAHFYTFGLGLNPRRLRIEQGASLCTCACHESCPVVDETRLAVPFRDWRDRCTCAGADAARRRFDDAGIEFPDMREQIEDRRRRSSARRDALQAVRAASGGRTRAEIRQLYVDEMRSRGLDLPADEVIDAHLDFIGGNPVPAMRLAGQSMTQAARALAEIARMFRPKSG